MAEQIIYHSLIQELMDKKPKSGEVEEILDKALHMKGISLEESAKLLNVEDDILLDKFLNQQKKSKS